MVTCVGHRNPWSLKGRGLRACGLVLDTEWGGGCESPVATWRVWGLAGRRVFEKMLNKLFLHDV